MLSNFIIILQKNLSITEMEDDKKGERGGILLRLFLYKYINLIDHLEFCFDLSRHNWVSVTYNLSWRKRMWLWFRLSIQTYEILHIFKKSHNQSFTDSWTILCIRESGDSVVVWTFVNKYNLFAPFENWRVIFSDSSFILGQTPSPRWGRG